MQITTNRLARLPILAAIILVANTAVNAASDPFADAVKHIEKQYHARQTHIPFVGLANFVLKFWHPAGVKNIRLAVFQNQNLTSEAAGPDFDKKFRDAAGGEWQPIVQVYSRKNDERTYIYHAEPGKDMKILVVSLGKNDAVVAQVKFEPEKLAEFMQNPQIMGVTLARDIRQGPSNSGPTTAGSEVAARGGSGWQSGQSSHSADEGQPAPAGDPRVRPVLHKASEGEPDAGSMPVAAPAKPEEGAIRLEARLVNLNVKVTDNSGKVVAGLGKDDFLLFEEGVRQDLAFFEPNTSPVNMVLLLDLSGSTKHKTKVMKKAACKFVDSLEPSDRIAVAAFTRRFQVVSDFTADHNMLKRRIEDMKNRGAGTAFYDGTWAALDVLAGLKEARKALVVLTDGVDNSLDTRFTPKHSFEELVGRAAEQDATIYPIYLDTEMEQVKERGEKEHLVYATARQQLNDLAEQTAGTMFKAVDEEDLKGAYKQVAAELHSFYSMAYSPKNSRSSGQWRKIAVKVSRDGGVAQTRKGVYDR
jgi:Ca-activated chloride channel family protein